MPGTARGRDSFADGRANGCGAANRQHPYTLPHTSGNWDTAPTASHRHPRNTDRYATTNFRNNRAYHNYPYHDVHN
ncbi:MAG: hypothetical protein Fur0021_03540 [Candidatus Promineifilaceae bacterium]